MAILLDNGNTIIQFKKPKVPASTLFVTFDAGGVPGQSVTTDRVLKKSGFAEAFLTKSGFDCIFVKRRVVNFYQDLSCEDFFAAVSKISASYERVYTYGNSGGAYGAIYFASCIGATPICISPRLSIHPEYGQEGRGTRFGISLKHGPLKAVSDPKIKPLIIVDPIDIVDRGFLQNEIRPSFPGAHIVLLPRMGHDLIEVLAETRALSGIIVDFARNDKVPKARNLRSLRSRSPYFLAALAQRTLAKRKVAATSHILDVALSLIGERVSKAPKEFEKLQTLTANLYLRRAVLAARKGDSATQYQALVGAVLRAPANFKVHAALARYYLKKNEFENALVCSSRMISLRADRLELHQLHIEALAAMGYHARAFEHADLMGRSLNGEGKFWTSVATTFVKAGNHSIGLECCKRGIRWDSDSPTLRRLAAKCTVVLPEETLL